VPYARWIKEGLITATEGDVVDYALVKEKLKWAREVFELRELAYDPYNATQLVTESGAGLMDNGFLCVPIRQGYGSMSEPTKKLLELVESRKLRHGDHPVLTWNADCLELKSDDQGNIRPVKPDRRKTSSRIDGMVALIMALGRATIGEGAPSIYGKQPLQFVG
jgi:phage terminase large subunit-like protein